ncbi:calcium-binding protein [Paenibacillus sp. FSL R7-0297]|uniref:calcium-binding protein n=1 Tax=Paenibacillus sp. FSL R7-0297 TaxID=2921680 RepID=UPI004040BA25
MWNEAAVRAAARNVKGSEASESFTGYEDNDILLGYGGDDTLSGGDGDDVLDGGNGNDTLYGNAGNDRLQGGQGADMLQGGAGDDVLDGGAGNDTLYGGDSSDTYYTRANGNDTYLFGRNSGQDTIVDYDGTAGNADVIRFAADVKPGDVTVRRSGSSLELLINGTSDKLTVASFFDASGRYVVESAVFADGTVWDEAALRTAALNIDGSDASETLSGYETNDTLRGDGGDDRLYGSAGDDVLDGGAGSDTLYGGDSSDTSYTRANGNDTYLFGRGFGQDTIVDYDGTAGNTDVIRFAAEVKPDDITVRRSGSSLELLINSTNDKLTVANYFEPSGKYIVESVQFADGTVWNEAAVRAAARNVTGSEASESLTGYEDNDILLGYGGDDTLSGGAGDDVLDGGNGNDTLYGNAGNDRLLGGQGVDMLQGGLGDDVLDGGAGNDTLYGGDNSDSATRFNGNDTYLFGRGSGQDTIIDYDGTEGNADVIRFAADVKPGDVTVRRSGSSLELLINGTSDKLTVASFFDASGRYVVESAVFADGTVWDEAALRTAALNIDGSDASETLSGYETNDTLRGYGGDDRLNGGAGDDMLDGGAGNDTLYGGDPYDTSYTRANGNDTYLFGRGYGQDTIVDYDGTAGNTDVIQFAADVKPGDITVRRSGSSLELLINGTSDKLTVANYFEPSGKYVVESVHSPTVRCGMRLQYGRRRVTSRAAKPANR